MSITPHALAGSSRRSALCQFGGVRTVAVALGGAPAFAAPPAQIGAGEGAVDIVAWAGYLERGETDKAYDWVTGFEKETGCKVNAKYASSSDEMTSLMNQGGFDLVTASGDASLRLAMSGTLQEINTSLIKDWSAIDPRLQNGSWHTVDGKHFGVPLTWGANLLIYDTNVFPTAPTSWDVVFTEQNLPDGKSNKGRVLAYYGAIYIADAALYLKAHKPELGITDPYELDEKQYAAALELLRGQRKIVARYFSDPNVQVEDFKREKLAASQSWPFQANLLKAANYPIGVTIPSEGATGWADTTMMHVNAKHPNCAYMWLNHSLEIKMQGDLASWYGSVPVVIAACKENALLGEAGCKANLSDDFDKISFWKTPVAKCAAGTCVPYSKWVTDYLAIQGGN